DLTNGQLTPNNNTPLLTQALSVMNNYQAAAAQGFGPPASPHAAAAQSAQRAAFPAASSPGPALDMYNSSGGGPGDSVGYVQAASPQPSSFPAIAVSRAPLNYSPVSYKVSTHVATALLYYRALLPRRLWLQTIPSDGKLATVSLYTTTNAVSPYIHY
ncbi:hypothetical protein HUJ04_000044, partial [Dendroctonus ponderosae]